MSAHSSRGCEGGAPEEGRLELISKGQLKVIK